MNVRNQEHQQPQEQAQQLAKHGREAEQARGFPCNRCGARLTDSTDYGDDALGLCYECAVEHYAND